MGSGQTARFDRPYSNTIFTSGQGGIIMAVTQQILLTAPPADCQRAMAYGVPVAHMAYRVGPGGRLYRSNLPLTLRGGLMALDAAGFEGRGDPGQLCREILRECGVRKFDGILCDFDGPAVPFLEQTVRQLGQATHQRGWPLYVTEEYGGASEFSRVLLPTAISGGTLEERLRTALNRYGSGRVTLAAQRAAEDYTLPSAVGQGRPLTRAELADRVTRFSPAVYFDHGLCAHHFTYMDQGVAHFVLFDDSDSLLRKLSLARDLGIERAVFAFPEVEDILPQLLGR